MTSIITPNNEVFRESAVKVADTLLIGETEKRRAQQKCNLARPVADKALFDQQKVICERRLPV